jgi:hypothetical protein
MLRSHHLGFQIVINCYKEFKAHSEAPVGEVARVFWPLVREWLVALLLVVSDCHFTLFITTTYTTGTPQLKITGRHFPNFVNLIFMGTWAHKNTSQRASWRKFFSKIALCITTFNSTSCVLFFLSLFKESELRGSELCNFWHCVIKCSVLIPNIFYLFSTHKAGK